MSTLTNRNPFGNSNGGEELGPLARCNPVRELEQIEAHMERLFRNWAARPEPKAIEVKVQ